MAFPTLVGVGKKTQIASATSQVVDMPASVAAEESLLAFGVFSDKHFSTAVTKPTGWTRLGGTFAEMGISWKKGVGWVPQGTSGVTTKMHWGLYKLDPGDAVEPSSLGGSTQTWTLPSASPGTWWVQKVSNSTTKNRNGQVSIWYGGVGQLGGCPISPASSFNPLSGAPEDATFLSVTLRNDGWWSSTILEPNNYTYVGYYRGTGTVALSSVDKSSTSLSDANNNRFFAGLPGDPGDPLDGQWIGPDYRKNGLTKSQVPVSLAMSIQVPLYYIAR